MWARCGVVWRGALRGVERRKGEEEEEDGEGGPPEVKSRYPN